MKFSGVKKISAAAIAAMVLVAGMTACGSSDSTVPLTAVPQQAQMLRKLVLFNW